MRSRLLGAFAALVGCAAVAVAQTPAPGLPVPVAPPVAAPALATPPGMVPVPHAPVALPPASLPAPPAAPPVMASNPNCGTPAAAPACNECKKAKHSGGGLLSKYLIGSGTATPVACGCLAAERTFMFGGCRQFFTPGKTCCGGGIEYGPGGMGQTENCKNVGSFINR